MKPSCFGDDDSYCWTFSNEETFGEGQCVVLSGFLGEKGARWGMADTLQRVINSRARDALQLHVEKSAYRLWRKVGREPDKGTCVFRLCSHARKA